MMHQWPTQGGTFSSPEHASWRPWFGVAIGAGDPAPDAFPAGTRVTEEGDVRVTEEGDVRVIE
jgi:hypothetical protein